MFSGAFDAEAAHLVCGGDDEFATMDVVASLVDKSLVVAAPRAHGPPTDCWRPCASTGRTASPATRKHRCATAHGEYFADLAERAWDGMRGRRSQDWLDLVEDQFDNIRAAWERAILAENVDQVVRIAGGLFMYNHTRRLPEIYQWVEQALALPDSHGHRLARHARLHRAYGMFMNAQGAVSEAEIRAVLAEGADDFDPLRPLGLCVLTQALYNLGRFQETAQLAARSRKLRPAGRPGLRLRFGRSPV